ncbi:hypothetical protein [Actinosynnema sp. NPDC020468]|uniref:hypothetical protein n=1 Tax=Actinosynnema sp. NPDC020468 TaxID=3154488 RepID=UPI003405989D
MTANRTVVEEPRFTVRNPPRTPFRRKRFLLPFGISAGVALAGAIALFAGGVVTLPAQGITVVRGMLASKRDFFEDAEVKRVLMAHGFQVDLTPVGSREIADKDDLDSYDFVFPSGQATADRVRDRRKGKHLVSKKPFFSPLVLGTYREYADALLTAGVIKPQGGDPALYYNLDVPAFVKLMDGTLTAGPDEEYWKHYPPLRNGNRIVAQTSDPCRTYSGSTWLALVAFAANGNETPHDESAALAVARRIKPLFDIEGQHGDDLAQQFFAPEGRTFAPIVAIYEHQFLANQFRALEGAGRPDTEHVLLYPEAQHETVPEFLSFTDAGDRLGRLVEGNQALRERAVRLGFHVFGAGGTYADSELAAELTARGLPTPRSGVGDTETWLPDLPLLERMVTEVGGCR